MRNAIFTLTAVILLVLGCCTTTEVKAQQDAQYSMYMFNGLAVNPAYAGSRDRLALLALYRHQWTGLKGAPKTFLALAHAPLLNDRIGLGLSVASDNIGVLNLVTISGNYAYRLPLGKGNMKGRLCFGLNTTVNYYNNRLSESQLRDAADPLFANDLKVTNLNFGAGAYYYNDHFYVGVSMPHFLNGNLNQSFELAGTDSSLARQWRHMFITVGGIVKLNDNVKFKPSMLFKHVKDRDLQGDFNASFLIKESLWLGASFRTTIKEPVAVVGMIEYDFAKNFRLGYAYDYNFQQIAQYQSGSHEIMVSYEFGKKETYLTPRKMSYF
ncbi:MAG: type IX secretion system membrane protein PorP/SprF [Chitinophagales bacterium]|nr:type IX secretion system membrane protein PorP/SprF [Chitinophagales bacterium]